MNKVKLIFNLLFTSPYKHTPILLPTKRIRVIEAAIPEDWRSPAWSDPKVLHMLNSKLRKQRKGCSEM